jgi:hypothetical protein
MLGSQPLLDQKFELQLADLVPETTDKASWALATNEVRVTRVFAAQEAFKTSNNLLHYPSRKTSAAAR